MEVEIEPAPCVREPTGGPFAMVSPHGMRTMRSGSTANRSRVTNRSGPGSDPGLSMPIRRRCPWRLPTART